MHSLVIGGTGMLSGVSLYLLSRQDTVSVIARHKNEFERLKKSAGTLSHKLNEIRIDYGNTQILVDELIKAVNLYGEISIAVCWIHSTAPEAVFKAAEILNNSGNENRKCRFFEILGSSSANPQNETNLRNTMFSGYKNILYRNVVLGFKIDKGKSRWLTDEEIYNGVIYAIENDEVNYIAGTVTPWNLHP